MLDLLLWLCAGLWALFFVQLLLNRLLAPDLTRLAVVDREEWPRVSIVVPARDEEEGIGAAVTSFCRQEYPDFEVIVVDDGSSDGTAEILDQLREEHPNLTVLKGTEPPPGWLGKPNALETGRRAASGEWLLFVDADVVYEAQLLGRAMTLALGEDVGMVVLGPVLLVEGAIEAAIMSHLYLVGLAVFPAYLVSRTRSRLFAIGGGVFNLVHRDALAACGAFESLKDAVVDDVALGYRVKAAGYRLQLAVSRDMITVRMYRGVRETVQGFTKNIYPGFSRIGPLWLIPAMTVGLTASLLPYVGFARGLMGGVLDPPSVLSLLFMHATLGAIAIFFRQPWQIAFLNPVRELAWWWIILRSFIHFRRHGLVWRRRRYSASATGPGEGE